MEQLVHVTSARENTSENESSVAVVLWPVRLVFGLLQSKGVVWGIGAPPFPSSFLLLPPHTSQRGEEVAWRRWIPRLLRCLRQDRPL